MGGIAMKHYYATITNRVTGRQFEIGAWSEKELRRDLEDIHRSGSENLDDCCVYIYEEEQHV